MTHSPPKIKPSSPDEVINLLRDISAPLDTEPVPLDSASGRLLREPVRAPEDQPPFDRSAFDGFAIRIDDPNTRFRIVDFLRAGDWRPRLLQQGDSVQIATGAALPADNLQVVMMEDTRTEGDHVIILARDQVPNIRIRGADAHKDQTLVHPLTTLSHGPLALLASVGHVLPLVTRLPHVLHLATGNEIVPPSQSPQPGQIRDSNSTLVRAFLNQWNIFPRQIHVPEDLTAALNALHATPTTNHPDPDILLVSGGASVGHHDFTRLLLEQSGYRILVHRTTTRPGKPLIVAQRNHSIAFGLPGNPLAHFVCLNLYVRTTLDALAGRPSQPLFHPGTLHTELPASANPRETFWPALCRLDIHGPRLTPLSWSSSGDLTPLARANALIRVPADTPQLAVDDSVLFMFTAHTA